VNGDVTVLLFAGVLTVTAAYADPEKKESKKTAEESLSMNCLIRGV
jgi:hypothetical protein